MLLRWVRSAYMHVDWRTLVLLTTFLFIAHNWFDLIVICCHGLPARPACEPCVVTFITQTTFIRYSALLHACISMTMFYRDCSSRPPPAGIYSYSHMYSYPYTHACTVSTTYISLHACKTMTIFHGDCSSRPPLLRPQPFPNCSVLEHITWVT